MYIQKELGTIGKGKSLMYGIQGDNPLCTIYLKGGGEVPDSLKGYWNDLQKAKDAVATHLNQGTLTKAAQEEKDYRARTLAAKNRPNKTTVKEA